jgi:hypothetical protein
VRVPKGMLQELYSPKSSLRVMREIGISYSNHQKLRHRAAQEGKPHLLASRRRLDLEQKNLEEGVEYVIDGDMIKLQSISTAVLKRLKNMDMNQKALLSLDKGQGRVLVTLAFPYRHKGKNIRSRPCSDTNHLVLASWEGEDKYEALLNRISNIHQVLTNELKLKILLGGDLGYLCANYGCHPSMTQPCPWCQHSFDKSSSGDKNSIPFKPTVLAKKRKAIPRKTPIWPVELVDVCLYRGAKVLT